MRVSACLSAAGGYDKPVHAVQFFVFEGLEVGFGNLHAGVSQGVADELPAGVIAG